MMMMITVRPVRPNMNLITVNQTGTTAFDKVFYWSRCARKYSQHHVWRGNKDSLFVIQMDYNIMHLIVPLNT